MILAPDGQPVPATEAASSGSPPSGLYIHVPFCISICPYCDFVVYAGKTARGPEQRLGRFLLAVEAELGLRADELDARWGEPGSAFAAAPESPDRGRPPLQTLYLGGGTPSLLPPASLARLIDLVRQRFGLADGVEVTLEVNPGHDERGDAGAIRAAGVTRLSVGAQSFEPAELRMLGRRHGPADIGATVRAARVAGLESISLDLLYDVPGQTHDSWSRTLDAALALEPDHISMYALTLDDPDAEGLTGPSGDHLALRRGARRWREQARRGQDEDRAASMYELADERVGAEGFHWYEISNWARPGHASRHNLGYWRGDAWDAVGPGAHAFDGATRRWNGAGLDGYLAALAPVDGSPGALPPGGAEPPGPRHGEVAMLALRTSAGLPMAALERPDVGTALAWGLDTGLLERVQRETAEPRLRLTRRGRLLSNELFARLT